MKLRSFRLRIALLSAVLSGTALVCFGLASWWLIYTAKVGRLDAKLENHVLRAARYRGDWHHYETTLGQDLGTESETLVALQVSDRDGFPLYQSANWPSDLPVGALALSLPPAQLPLFPDRLPIPPRPPLGFPPLMVPDRPNLPSEFPLLRPQITTQRTRSGVWRVGEVMLPQPVAIAVSLTTIDQEMVAIRHIFLTSTPMIMLLIAGGAGWLSGKALRPMRQLTTVIRQVTAKGLDQRVPIAATDVEFVELIRVFNQMLERLERSFKQASRFSGDAAHELKTPLTILQGELEQMIQQAEPGSPMQQQLGNLLDEVSHLSATTRKLLLLSLADAGQMRLFYTEVNLSQMLFELADDVELLAPELKVEVEIPDLLLVKGDRDLLTQVVQNLISNAIKYNLPQGWIRIQGRRQGNLAVMTMTNACKDMSPVDCDRVFERFYRGDPARTRQTEGVGLGLSLAREIARAHQGDLVLAPVLPGQTTLILTLPIDPIAA